MRYAYRNGNVNVSIDTNTGTKCREWKDNETPMAEFPESLDIKITNKCDLNCPYCHESSVKDGAHADLDKLLSKLSGLPKGIELAIGGGNPLTHPELPGFLRSCSRNGWISNITVNQSHLKKESTFFQVRQLKMSSLIHGIGVSYMNSDVSDVDFLMKYTDNVVLHCIVGVHDPEDIISLNLPYKKVLWLGYKSKGRGETFYTDPELVIATNYLIDEMRREFDVLSFDNLALNQLNVKDSVSEDEWKSFYQGDDFTISMYIDAVRGLYGPSSTSTDNEMTDWDSMNLIEYFKTYHK